MRASFLLHIDSLCILDKMSDKQAGELIKAIYYFQINGELPKDIDFIIEMAVTPFINQFKRDNEKYEQVIEKRKQAGAKGGKQKVANVANARSAKQNVANVAVNDNDSVNDSVNDNDSKEKKNIYQDLLEFLNAETNKNYRIIPDKAKKQINARLKDGYTLDDIKNAITNCSKDKYHIENPQYLTLEFITRSDKLEKYVNMLAPARVVSLKPTRDEIKARNWEYVVG